MESLRCQNKKGHGFHPYEVEFEVVCSGSAPCGQKDHSEHGYLVQMPYWCPGLCTCTVFPFVHGPKDHMPK